MLKERIIENHWEGALLRRCTTKIGEWCGWLLGVTVESGHNSVTVSETNGAVTNWSTFARPLSLPHSVQELHLPVFDWDQACPACIFGSLVIFQPASGRVAAMVAGKQALIDAIRANGMVGAPLDIKMA